MLCPTNNGFPGKVDMNEIKSSKALCWSLKLTSLLWKNILFPNTWNCVISIASFDIDWFEKTCVKGIVMCGVCSKLDYISWPTCKDVYYVISIAMNNIHWKEIKTAHAPLHKQFFKFQNILKTNTSRTQSSCFQIKHYNWSLGNNR